MQSDWSDLAYEDFAREQEEAEQYDVFRAHFRQEVADELVTAVRACYEGSWTDFNREMLYARHAVLRAGADDRIVAYVRSYRTVDWYQTRLSNAIATALVEPFKAYFGNGIPARKLLQPTIQRAVRDRIDVQSRAGCDRDYLRIAVGFVGLA